MWYEKTYKYIRWALWILYILTILGLWERAPQYIAVVDNILKIFIGLVLISLFNPWTHTTFNNFHRRIVFTSGLLLLVSSSLGNYLQKVPKPT